MNSIIPIQPAYYVAHPDGSFSLADPQPQLIDVDALVNRFLAWRLPEYFRPDAGISFVAPENPDWWPVGTNLFDADQAAQMIRHLLAAAPEPPVVPEGQCVVTKDDANNYCLILRELGMEEEGDPVTRVRELVAANESAQVPGLMYVPGMWRCAKCDFALLQSNLNAATGAVTPRDNPGDTCPNCATPMWRVTYRDAYADVMKLFEDHIVRERESALVVTDALRACAGALQAVCESGRASEKDAITINGMRKTISDILDDADDALAAPEPPAVSDADVERANS